MTSGAARAAMGLGVLTLGTLTLAPVLHGVAASGVTTGQATVGGEPRADGAKQASALPSPSSDVAPSAAVYPPYTPPHSISATFSHAQHARHAIGCERCHDTAARSLTSKDNLLPGEQTCRACHAQAQDEAHGPSINRTPAPKGETKTETETNHGEQKKGGAKGEPLSATGKASPVAYAPDLVLPSPGLKFNHQLHGARGMSCALCHAGVEQVALATTMQLPKMGLCLGCHDGRQATARCGACHPTLADGRLRTTFLFGALVPSGSLRGADAHTPAFRTQHQAAGRDEKYCATCHKQSECTECHAAGVIRPIDFHPVDYASLHAVDARRNIPNCSSCHRNQTFCLGCHQRLGVAPDPEGGQAGRQPNNPFGTGTGVKRFHPPGWVRDESGVVLTTPSPASHSLQARRNLRTCVSCHREESCLACHSADPTRSMGVNPHPLGFSGSVGCKAMASRNARACLKCHQAGTPALSCD